MIERFLAAMEDGIILAEVDGEGMIIDVEKSASYFLNETALLIFRMVNERKTVDDMKAVLLEQYDVDEGAVEKDIRDFLVRLEKKAISWKKENTLSQR
ncbi:MAG: PqqD family protein [Deltaproteobacteria bacterium]|nr:PqqD family protein [Deltaproteobacteria bacterium]